jgi:hypothetical protein
VTLKTRTRVPSQYVYVDVVRFTGEGRSVEAQSDIIAALNQIVRNAVAAVKPAGADVIYSPAGDGICIALPAVSDEYDLHLRLALTILELLQTHNAATTDESRRFALRAGVNQNVDNVVTDINGTTSLAGAGINMTQRIMDQAGPGQIMVGENVYGILGPWEKYRACFRPFVGKTKHGDAFNIYQYVKPSPGLSTESPPQFAPPLSELTAYYMLEAEACRSAMKLLGKGPRARDASTVFLYMRACDTMERDTQPWYEEQTIRANKATLDEQLAFYAKKVDQHVLGALAKFIHDTVADDETLIEHWCFPTPEGLERLRKEYPKLGDQLPRDGQPPKRP